MSIGASYSWNPLRRASLVCALLALLLLASCATGPSRRPTFVGRQEGAREAEPVEGLNPLASLDTCAEGAAPPAPRMLRVLVSPPAYFSKQATEMLVGLRRQLVGSPQGARIEMWLAARPLPNEGEARQEGLRCAATIVLWEDVLTTSLELTLPQPAEVPLRHMVRERLCEFGSDRQQGAVLFFTISGLAAMLDNRYDEAVYYMDAANRIDVSCFQLPDLPPRPAGETGDGPPPPQAPAPPQEPAPR